MVTGRSETLKNNKTEVPSEFIHNKNHMHGINMTKR